MRLSATYDFTLPAERSNAHHLVWDITWFGLAFAATNRFLSVYALRLNATALELGLIASLPAIVMLFSAAFGNWWMRRHGNTVQALFWPGLGFRLLFLLPAFAPFFPLELQPMWLIMAVTLPAIPQGIAGVTFVVMMREAIADNHLGAVVSKRMVGFNAGIGVAALSFGLLLEKAPFPFNYQVMFVLAFIFSLVSLRHCTKINVISPTSAQAANNPAIISPWRSQKFMTVAFVIVASHIAFSSIVPITPMHLVKNLGASEGFMALFGLAELVAGGTIAFFISQIVEKIGNRSLIAFGMMATAIAGLIIGLAHNLPITLLSALISGAGWTATGIGVFGFFNESTDKEAMPKYTIAYQQVIGLSLFIGPMVGSVMANGGMSVMVVVLIGAVMRLLAGVLIEHHVFSMLAHSPRLRFATRLLK